MLLDLKTLKTITAGAERVIEEDGYFCLLRFTEAEANAYLEAGHPDFYKKTFSSTGIRLAFRTTSRSFSFRYRSAYGSSRKFGHFDVYLNGAMEMHFGSEGEEMTEGKIVIPLPEGETDVEIHFPFSRRTDIRDVEMDDGATLTPIKRKYTMIQYGDSITHAYDAIHPSLAYTALFSSLMDADAVNKGIGGDIFFPALLNEKHPESPDFITVAYGSNDWCKCTKEEFVENCTAFFKGVSELYPHAKIIAIAPIWHLGFDDLGRIGVSPQEQNNMVKDICKDIPNTYYIDGWTLTPHRKEFYTDAAGHPNETCFVLYAMNLYKQVRDLLEA